MAYSISDDATFVSTAGRTTSTNSTSITDGASLAGNYSTFLGLLTAQIRNQDPLSPMDTTQWTNQLVQYSSVEQQLKANQYLAQMAGNNTGTSMNSAVGYIGKTVSAASNSSMLSGGEAKWDYSLGVTASKVTATISDTNGKTIWTGDLSELEKGDHTFTWDGKDTAGKAVPDGYYNLKIDAKTGTNTSVDTTISLSGVVTSAQNVNGTIMVKVGKSEVPLATITKVS